jgi:hypothetical protein
MSDGHEQGQEFLAMRFASKALSQKIIKCAMHRLSQWMFDKLR